MLKIPIVLPSEGRRRGMTEGGNPERKQWKCSKCRKKFSVTSRSIFEGSKIRLGYWIYAIWSMCSSKKGVIAPIS